MEPPAIGDIVHGMHSEGFEVIGRLERKSRGKLYVRTDDGRLLDMGHAPVTVIERCNTPTFKYWGVTYCATVPRPSSLGRVRAGVVVRAL